MNANAATFYQADRYLLDQETMGESREDALMGRKT